MIEEAIKPKKIKKINITFDASFKSIISKQNKSIKRGIRLDKQRYDYTKDITESILNEHDVTCIRFYGDGFKSSTLIRLKAEIPAGTIITKNLLQKISEDLAMKFPIIQVTYLNDDKPMILIWM